MVTMLSSFVKSISDMAWVFIVHCIPLVYVHNIFHLLDLFLSIFEKVLAFPLIPSAFSPVLTKIEEARRYLDELSSNMEKDTNDLGISGFMDGIGKFVWYIFDTFLTSIYAIEIVKLFNFGLFLLDFLLGWFTLLPFINPCREKLHVLMKYAATLETKLENPLGEDLTLSETGKRKFDQIKEALSNQESICKMFKVHKAPKEAVETMELEDPKTEAVFEDHTVVNVFKPEVHQVTPEILSNLGLAASTNNDDIVNPKSTEDLIKPSNRNVALASIGKISLKPIEEISEVVDENIESSSTGAKNKADLNVKPVVVMIESLAMNGTMKKDKVTDMEPTEANLDGNMKPAEEMIKIIDEPTKETLDNNHDVDVLLEEATEVGENFKPNEENVAKPSPKMKLVGVVKPMVETSHDNTESSRTSYDMKAEAAKERAWVGLKKSYDDQKSNQNGAKTTENVVSNKGAANGKIIPNGANASEYNSPKNGSDSANFKKNGSSSDTSSPQSNQNGKNSQSNQNGKNSPVHNMEASKLFVFGVDESLGQEDMAREFRKFGDVVDVYNTGKGFAFVTMSTPEQANAALEKLDGAQVFGKEIKVSIAVAKPAGGGRGRQSPTRGQQRGRGRGQQRGRGRGQQMGRGRGGRGQ